MSAVYGPTGAGPWVSSLVVPTDGDANTAASIVSPLEAVADNAQWLHDRTGSHRLVAFNGASSASIGVAFPPMSGGMAVFSPSTGTLTAATLATNDVLDIVAAYTVEFPSVAAGTPLTDGLAYLAVYVDGSPATVSLTASAVADPYRAVMTVHGRYVYTGAAGSKAIQLYGMASPVTIAYPTLIAGAITAAVYRSNA